MDCEENVDDLDPMCYGCNRSKFVGCMDDDEREKYFDNVVICHHKCKYSFSLFADDEDYVAALGRISKEMADGMPELNETDVYICPDCHITNGIALQLKNALKQIEEQQLEIERLNRLVEQADGPIPTMCVRRFNMTKFASNRSNIIIIGTDDSQPVIKSLMHAFSLSAINVRGGMVVATTEQKADAYSKYVARESIQLVYDDKLIADFAQRQMANPNQDHKSFLVVDNVICNTGQLKCDSALSTTIMNARHINICPLILTTQYPVAPPSVRANFDYVFISPRSWGTTELKRLYEQYAGMFPEFSDFILTFNGLTKDGSYMVIDNTVSSSSGREKKIFGYNPVEFNTPDFMISS